jgi:hypothetical protein
MIPTSAPANEIGNIIASFNGMVSSREDRRPVLVRE